MIGGSAANVVLCLQPGAHKRLFYCRL